MTATIVGPKSLTVPSLLGGNDQVYGLVLVAVTRGLFVEELGNGQVRLAGIKDFSLVTPDIISLLVSKGAEVIGYPTFIRCDPEDSVPEGIPGRDYVDDLGNQQIKTWNQWKSANHEFMEREGHLYVEGVYGEQYLPASVWVPLRAGGMTILSRTEFAALSPSE